MCTEILGVDINHTTTRDGCWRCILEVSNLHDKLAVILEANAISVGKNQERVVVHHRVHVLDPNCIDIPIKDDAVMPVGGGGNPVDVAEDVGKEAIDQFTRFWVHETVESLYNTVIFVDRTFAAWNPADMSMISQI